MANEMILDLAVRRSSGDLAVQPRSARLPQIQSVHVPRWSQRDPLRQLGPGGSRLDGRMERILLQNQSW